MTKGKFPNGLLRAMTAKGIGATELGGLVGEPKQNISRWRDGERRLKPEMAVRLAKHLGVTVNSLLMLPETADTEPAAPSSTQREETAGDGKGKITDPKAAATLLELLEIVPEGQGKRAYAALLNLFGPDDEKLPPSDFRGQFSPANPRREATPSNKKPQRSSS